MSFYWFIGLVVISTGLRVLVGLKSSGRLAETDLSDLWQDGHHTVDSRNVASGLIATTPSGLVYGVHFVILPKFGRQHIIVGLWDSDCVCFSLFLSVPTHNVRYTKKIARARAGGSGDLLARGAI